MKYTERHVRMTFASTVARLLAQVVDLGHGVDRGAHLGSMGPFSPRLLGGSQRVGMH
jgi:hypothetical protein